MAEARPSVDELVALYDLKPMATENIVYRRTYECDQAGPDGKPLATAIIALMTGDSHSFSDMHRLSSDEGWHFYLGDPIELLVLNPDGTDELVILGQDVLGGEQPQFVVRAGAWFGARVRPGGEYALFGCTVSPGFTQDDFEAGDPEALIAAWPAREALIRAMSQN